MRRKSLCPRLILFGLFLPLIWGGLQGCGLFTPLVHHEKWGDVYFIDSLHLALVRFDEDRESGGGAWANHDSKNVRQIFFTYAVASDSLVQVTVMQSNQEGEPLSAFCYPWLLFEKPNFTVGLYNMVTKNMMTYTLPTHYDRVRSISSNGRYFIFDQSIYDREQNKQIVAYKDFEAQPLWVNEEKGFALINLMEWPGTITGLIRLDLQTLKQDTLTWPETLRIAGISEKDRALVFYSLGKPGFVPWTYSYVPFDSLTKPKWTPILLGQGTGGSKIDIPSRSYGYGFYDVSLGKFDDSAEAKTILRSVP
jgi:hypothetical protein